MGQDFSQYSSLTDGERAILRESFEPINQNLAGLGNSLFTTIFKEHPRLTTYFPFTSNKEDRFQKHCDLFSREIALFVRNVDKPEVLRKLLEKNAARHVDRHVGQEQYDMMRDSVLRAFQIQIGMAKFHGNLIDIWDKAIMLTFDFILTQMEAVRAQKAAACPPETPSSSGK